LLNKITFEIICDIEIIKTINANNQIFIMTIVFNKLSRKVFLCFDFLLI